MEDWERRVSSSRHEAPYRDIIRIERMETSEEREPCWRAGDGLRVLNP
jgi:hypothetical protein